MTEQKMIKNIEAAATGLLKTCTDEFIDDRMVKGFNLPYFGECNDV